MKLIEIDGKYINPEHVAVVQPGPKWESLTAAPTFKSTIIMVSGYTIDVRRPPAEVADLLGLT